MGKRRIISLSVSGIGMLFTLIVSVLTLLSLFYHCKVNIYVYDLPRTIESHSPLRFGGLAVFAVISLLALCYFTERILRKIKDQWMVARGVLFFCLGFIGIGSIIWILFNDALPKSDQAIIFEEARKMAGLLEGEFNTSYFGWFPRNRGLALLMAGLLQIFGDTQLAFRMLNVAGAILLILSVYFATKRAWKNAQITIIALVLITLYYPVIIYTSYLYGTLLSVALASCGFCAAVRFCDEFDWKSIIVAMISFPMAIQMHQSAAIALIAAGLYVLFHMSKKVWKKTMLFIVAPIMTMLLFNYTVDFTYEKITSAEPIDPVPSITWIYMGLTSENELGGPGCQDGSMYQLYADNGYDAKATSKDAIHKIGGVVGEYLRGERKWEFFLEKTKHQWLDPTFTARRAIRLNEIENGEIPNSEAYTEFYFSGIRDKIYRILVVYLIMIYSLNVITGFRQSGKESSVSLLFLIQLFFIGGFVFQLAWESIARYCFSYFIWLIPQAAYGAYILNKGWGKWKEKKNENRNI